MIRAWLKTMKGKISAVFFILALASGVVFYNDWRKADNVPEALVKGQYHRAAALLKPLAQTGSNKAQQLLGNLYYLGLGVKQDAVKAAGLFKQSAIQGNSAAQYNLGLIHHLGRGVDTNNVTAAAWFMFADAAGNTSAQTYLRNLSGMMNPNMIQEAHALKDTLAKEIKDNHTN